LRAWRVIVVCVAFVTVGACGVLDQGVAQGPCSLVVRTVDDQSVMQVLEPPYRTALGARRLVDSLGERDISSGGQGWGPTRVELDGPRGSRSEIVDGENINGEFQGWCLARRAGGDSG
jgi:hypothetical protein